MLHYMIDHAFLPFDAHAAIFRVVSTMSIHCAFALFAYGCLATAHRAPRKCGPVYVVHSVSLHMWHGLFLLYAPLRTTRGAVIFH